MQPQKPRNRHERRAAEANLKKAMGNHVDDLNNKMAEKLDWEKETHVTTLHPTKGFRVTSMSRVEIPDSKSGRARVMQGVIERAQKVQEKNNG